MKKTKTIQLELKPNPNQTRILKDLMNQYNEALNFVSLYVFKTYNMDDHFIGNTLSYALTNTYHINRNITYTLIHSVIAKYKTLLRKNLEWKQISFKKPYCELLYRSHYTINNDYCFIKTGKGTLKLRFNPSEHSKYFNNPNYKPKTAKLINKKDVFYLNIPITYYTEEKQKNQ